LDGRRAEEAAAKQVEPSTASRTARETMIPPGGASASKRADNVDAIAIQIVAVHD
jgi:hypothetical protein